MRYANQPFSEVANRPMTAMDRHLLAPILADLIRMENPVPDRPNTQGGPPS